MIDKLDAALSFHQTALRVRSQRQELIAANIANADTPNYKARDIDFNATLAKALSGTATENMSLQNTSAQHLPITTLDNSLLSTGALYRRQIQGSADGNTVDMDVERNQFTDNGIRYEASLTMINAKIKSILGALQG